MSRSGVRVHVTSTLEDATCVLVAPRHLREEEWCKPACLRGGQILLLDESQVRLARGHVARVHVLEILVSVLRGHGGEQKDGALHADGIVVVGPVRGGGDRRLRRQLESFYDAADFVHVGRRMRGSSAAA